MSIFYVNPLTGDDGDVGGLGDPWLTIDHIWSVVGPDDIVLLFDDLTGGYTGDDNMIRPPASFGGTPGHPIKLKALNDGMVLIDGQFSRLPLLLDGNEWLDFEGFNAAHSDSSVTEGVITTNNFSHDINFRRIVAWDGSQTENSQVFETNNSQRVLWEDCAAFGTGRKAFSIYESNDCTARRCWGQWQDNVAVNPQLVFTNYSSYGSRFENCIATWDGGHTMYSPGLFIAGQMTGASTMPWSDSTLNSHTIFEGCIGYQLGSQAGYWDAGGIDAGAFVDYITFKDMAFYSEQNVFGYTYSDLRVVPEFGNSIPHQSAIAQNITVILPDPSTSGGGNNDGWGQRETPGEWTRTNENNANSVAAAYPSGQSLYQNDGTRGATICFEVVNGVTTSTPLFPWKMNQRIIDAMSTTAYTVRDVTADVTSIWGTPPTITPGSIPPIENFDSYTTSADYEGATGGSGDWTGPAVKGDGGAMTIVVVPFGGGQGGKCLKSITGGADTYYYRTFLGVSNNVFTWEMASNVTNPNDDSYGVSFHESGVSIRTQVQFSSGGNIRAYNYDTSSWVNVLVGFAANTFYRLELAIDLIGHPDEYRVRVNEGTWSAWIGAAGTMTVLNHIQFNNSTSNGTIWWDAIGCTSVPATAVIGQLLLDKILKDTPFALFPLWLSLHTGPPGLNGIHEVVGGSYGRFAASESYWSTPASRSITNVTQMQFSAMPACTVTHVGLWSSSTGGTPIRFVPLNNPRTITAGQTPKFSVGAVTFALTDDFSTYMANAVLGYLFKGTAFTSAPAYWSLHTGAKDATGGHEVTGGSYARQEATIADWETAGESILGDTIFSLDFQALVEFAGMPAVSLTRLGLFDASSSGHFLMWGPSQALVVGGGDTVSIDGTVPGNLAATLTQIP